MQISVAKAHPTQLIACDDDETMFSLSCKLRHKLDFASYASPPWQAFPVKAILHYASQRSLLIMDAVRKVLDIRWARQANKHEHNNKTRTKHNNRNFRVLLQILISCYNMFTRAALQLPVVLASSQAQ